MTSETIPSATFSQVSECGQLRLDLPAGPMSGRCGPALAPASRSVQPAGGKGSRIDGIYGPTFIRSSVPAGPLSAWESKLRANLAARGGMEYRLTWKHTVTPRGRWISRLAASAPRASDRAFIGWPCVKTSDANGAGKHGTGGPDLRTVAASLTGYPAVTTRDWKSARARKTTAELYDTDGRPLSLVALEMVSGKTSNCADQTPADNGAALNAELCLWLQGIPADAIKYAPPAMRSTRNLRRK